jgi:ornithine cyclodeaminase/alanine dehydrogenase-like protein (mu-crystallin family)
VGPGDCHIKAGYIEGSPTWTVKLANVSFYRNIERSLSPGSGIFIVCSAVHGRPLGIFQENRYLTDLRTGAAGAVVVKHLVERSQHRVAFIGTGAIATAMAEATHCVHQFEYGFAYGTDRVRCQIFANEIHDKLGMP